MQPMPIALVILRNVADLVLGIKAVNIDKQGIYEPMSKTIGHVHFFTFWDINVLLLISIIMYMVNGSLYMQKLQS